jgi:hypothetical protein
MSATPNSNRADSVRQRRTARSQSRQEHTARYVANPPVTVRGSGMGQPVIQRTSVRPRRVFTVALQQAGPALSIPAPAIHFGWRGLSAVLLIALVGLIYFLTSSDKFKIDKPVITGVTRLSVADIEAVLKLNGRSIFSVDPYVVATDMQKSFPELNGLSISVGIPNTVSVQFDERLPVLAWKQKEQIRWVDAHGVIFNPRGDAPAGLVMVTSESEPPRFLVVPTPGPTPTVLATAAAGAAATATPSTIVTRMDLNLLSSALVLSKHLPDKAILIYSESEGLGWRDSRGWDVYFGNTMDSLDVKISMGQAIVDQLNQKKLKPVVINLVRLNAPYYRTER